MNNYKLTKSRIISGNQCEKKLWFDINDPEDKQKFEFERGYRFEDEVKKIYAKGLNAVDLSKDKKDRIIRTDQAINSKEMLVPNNLTWNSTPPTLPDDNGKYLVAIPGKTQFI